MVEKIEDNNDLVEKFSIMNEGIEDIMLDVAWKDYDVSSDDKRALDNKANMILVACGVLLGLIINGISIMYTPFAILSISILILYWASSNSFQ